MYYEVVSDRDVVVTGVGLLESGKPVKVDELGSEQFKLLYGYPLSKANFPNYVKVTLVSDEGPQEVAADSPQEE